MFMQEDVIHRVRANSLQVYKEAGQTSPLACALTPVTFSFFSVYLAPSQQRSGGK